MFWSSPSAQLKILVVCTANICRSPLAEGIIRHRLRQLNLHKVVQVKSAGTRARPGEAPDARALRLAREGGFNLKGIKSRKVDVEAITDSDIVLVMDRENMGDLLGLCPKGYEDRIQYLLDFPGTTRGREVPDPYYASFESFRSVHEMMDKAISEVLLPAVIERVA